MISFLVHWLVQAVALFVTVRLVSGVSVASYGVLAVAALVIGLVNALVRPLLTILSFPLTILTLGTLLPGGQRRLLRPGGCARTRFPRGQGAAPPSSVRWS